MTGITRRELILGMGGIVAALAGCGGGGGSGGIANALSRAIVPILFPGDVGGEAAAFLSAVVTVFGGGSGGQDLLATVNVVGDAAETLEAIIADIVLGSFDLVVDLFSAAAGAGSLVSRAAMLLNVQTAGQSITTPSITTMGTTRAITILPNQREPVNQAVSLLVGVTTTNGDLLAVNPADFVFATPAPTTGVSVSGSGPTHIIAAAPTSGTVTVTLNGVTSAPQTVNFS